MTRKTKAAAGQPESGGTKKAHLIRLLSAKTSVEVWTISGQLGWQPHTTRAAIAGLKKAGYEIATEKPERGMPTRYRIAAQPGPAEDEDTPQSEPVDAG